MNVHLLERVTSSGKIIKYIDGLRFIAVASVFICHFLANHLVNFPEINEYRYIFPFFGNGIGHTGVYLFFGISGFILSLPFLKQYVYGGREVSIKDYFLRRLTRLEPPYIVHLVLFLFISTVLGNKSIQELFPNFLASLFYVHNIVFSEERYPLINIVLWTLEIEVQFYILAPLLSLGIFKLPKWIRRALMLGIIVLWPLLGINTGFHNILNYLHFFIIGFLVADLSLEYSDKIKSSYVFDILCVIAFLIFWQGNVWLEFQWLYIFILLFLTPFSIFWKKMMEFRPVYIIGGMCYTIYMLHHKIIYVFFGMFFKGKVFFGDPIYNLFTRFIIISIITLLISAVFFIFVERPTMKKQWWKYRDLKKLFFE